MKKDRKIKNKIFSKLLTLTGILFVASLFFTGCANFAGSSDSKKETFTITVKTQNITSKTETKNRNAFPALFGSKYYTLSYKSGESTDWKSLDGTFPDYQMIIIPGTYTLKLDVYSDSGKTNHILTGNNSLTVTSGMENAEVSFILQPPKNATGNGSVSLVLSAETDTQITTFEINSDKSALTLTWTKDDREAAYTKGTITADPVTAGTYHLTIYGKTTTDETVYVRSETLTVWEGLESSVWIFADGSFSNELKIKTDDLYSTFYVKGEEGPYNFYKEGVFGDANASDDNSGSIDCPLSTVSAAVNKCVVSNKPYTIYVDGTVKEAIDSTSTDPSAIEIYKKIITIKSIKPEVGKAVIQADGNGRIMYAGGTVVLEDLELKGGGNTNLGGGIFVGHASVLTMKNCTITECNATHQGGGLYIYSQCSANLSGCTISGNEATDENSGIGGGIMAYGTLIADGTSISNNNSGNGGGGLYIASDVTATLIGCEFSKNTTEQSGGAIKNSGTLNITDCSFSENTANFGGGIDVDGGTVNITGTGEDTYTCVFQSNTADGGGAMSVSSGTVQAEKVKFDSNSSISTGGIGGGGGFWIAKSSVTLTNCNLSNNTAANLGGAVLVVYDSSISWVSSSAESSLTMNGGTVSSNTAPNGGGGICIDDAKGTVKISGCKISENSANGSGGGLKICSPAELTNCEILQNSSGGDGGGLECICRDTTQINVTFTNCKIIGKNTSGNNGGGVSINSNVKATFNNCEINGNTAKYNGGGLLLWHQNGYSDPDVTLTDCTISSNTANNENGNGGGGIRTDGGGLTLKLTGTTSISGNITQSGGVGKGIYLNSGYMYISGAIQIDDDVRIPTDVIRTTITGSLTGTTPVITITPTGYTAGKQIVSAGSGVTLSDEAGKFKISNPDYIISKEGKLCYLGTTSTTAEDNIAVFTNIPARCEATVNLDNLSQTSWSGSSPASISGNVTLTASTSTTISSGSDSIFTVKNGGTLTLNENVTLETSSPGKSCINVEEGGTLILNGATIQATPGYNVSGITITHGTLTINTGNITNFTGSTIVATDSIVTITGGKISTNNSNVKLTDCTADIRNLIVTGNTTSSNGGGINISGSGTYTFNNCTITSNTASVRGGTPRYGGGIYIDTTGTVSFTKCNISGNTAKGYTTSNLGKGGGIYLNSGRLTTTGCTISSNTTTNGTAEVTGSGSQIYAVAGSVYNGKTLTEDKIIDTYSEQ